MERLGKEGGKEAFTLGDVNIAAQRSRDENLESRKEKKKLIKNRLKEDTLRKWADGGDGWDTVEKKEDRLKASSAEGRARQVCAVWPCSGSSSLQVRMSDEEEELLNRSPMEDVICYISDEDEDNDGDDEDEGIPGESKCMD
ncbi:hypothetical protein Q5P01_007416 [Channa striata]|uniref:Uncharacterized protein n=1 Tax=Channa striata TaxID=64152 RepID=A0AA88SUU3_CHASR|nr:hypothetical protein Q5P01_007416 [Channa striata]